ncbi:MAG: hypothetical protein WD066_09540 [Planctomycetaceae bacterium]
MRIPVARSPRREPNAAVGTFSLFLVLLLVPATVRPENSKDAPSKTWKDFANEFDRETVDENRVATVTTLEQMLELPSVRTLTRQGNRRLWQAMLHHEDSQVAAFGYLCIRRHEMKPTPIAALVLCGRASDELTLGLAVTDAKSADWSRVPNSEITMALVTSRDRLAGGQFPRTNLVLALSLMPEKKLEAWVASEEFDSPAVDGLVAAHAMSDLCSRFQVRNAPMPAKIAERLSELRDIPGYSRSVFVAHAPTSAPGFDAALKAALADPELTEADVMIVVIYKGEYLRQEWGRLADGIPKVRREFVKKALKIIPPNEPEIE